MRRTRQCCIFRSRKAIKEYSGNRSGISLRHMRPWLFLAPSLGGTAIFVLIPFVNVVVRSFFQAVGGQFVGMENFIQVFHSQAFRQGLLDQLAVWAGGRGQDWLNQGSAFYILVLTYIWKNTGYDMMLWLAGLDGIPKELFEAAKVDGAGSWQSFFYVALPGLGSTAFLVLVLSVINSFKVFREAYLISGDYPHESIYMLQHLFNHWFVSLDIQKMSAASVMVETSILIPALLWSRKRKKRW